MTDKLNQGNKKLLIFQRREKYEKRYSDTILPITMRGADIRLLPRKTLHVRLEQGRKAGIN